MKIPTLAVMLLLSLVPPARADPLSDGHDLVRRLLSHRPSENFTASGTLDIRDGNGGRSQVPVRFESLVTATNWFVVYEAGVAGQLAVVHAAGQPDKYYYSQNLAVPSLGGMPGLGPLFASAPLNAADTMGAFAGSDFWIVDLGVGFLHWPQQKILKTEMKRSRGCIVLESTNPHPTPGGYSRVVSWVDKETDGFVQAYAYDIDGRLLKEFYPKDFKRVNGQWQVGTMEMDNDQTGSRTRLVFDLNGSDSPQK